MKTGFIVWLLAVTLSTTESVSDGFCVLSEKTDGQSNKMTRFLLKQSTQNEVTDDALISVSELTEEPCINNSTVEYRLEPSDLLDSRSPISMRTCLYMSHLMNASYVATKCYTTVLKFEGTFQQLVCWVPMVIESPLNVRMVISVEEVRGQHYLEQFMIVSAGTNTCKKPCGTKDVNASPILFCDKQLVLNHLKTVQVLKIHLHLHVDNANATFPLVFVNKNLTSTAANVNVKYNRNAILEVAYKETRYSTYCPTFRQSVRVFCDIDPNDSMPVTITPTTQGPPEPPRIWNIMLPILGVVIIGTVIIFVADRKRVSLMPFLKVCRRSGHSSRHVRGTYSSEIADGEKTEMTRFATQP
ncbi:uncharacterized protein LOC128244674 isoform X1 [Mya arenaria]|uniref:uncharacterized protein LOC128244674 isoform X1 n=1 Tax=Mya arenaria TaxID=6604 RepID=UPI0022E1E9DF|nr:uncharacterized protein LOC128244674 isoform X1 [Mya arenaria]